MEFDNGGRGRLPKDSLIEEIGERRQDEEFMDRLDRHVREDAPLLDRLTDGPPEDKAEVPKAAKSWPPTTETKTARLPQ